MACASSGRGPEPAPEMVSLVNIREMTYLVSGANIQAEFWEFGVEKMKLSLTYAVC